MKKGFTLAELMGVFVLMALFALIIIPIVDKQIKDGKQREYNEQINVIKSSLDLYMNDIELDESDTMQITLYQLKHSGYISNDIINPLTGTQMPNDSIITISNDNGNYIYDINTSVGVNTKNYENLPEMNILGNTVTYVELGDTYEEKGATSLFNYNEIEISIDSNVKDTVGIYRVIYTSNYENMSNKIIRTVIVKDRKGPDVSFDTLNIPLSSARRYDYKSDIETYDVSGVKDIEVETNFGALTGIYSVKYTVTDNYGNKTVKYRKVITS